MAIDTKGMPISIGALLVIIVGIIAVMLILKNKSWFNFGATIGAAAGDTATGPHVYQTVGSPSSDVPEEKERCGGRSVDMGIATSLDSYEATAIIDYGPADQTCHCGKEFDIKMFGPGHHADANANPNDCCWWLFCINNDGNGSITTGGEGPHPDTVKTSAQGVKKSSIGGVGGKKIGIKGVTWKNADGASRHVEGWVDVTGAGTSWEKVVEDNLTTWGNNTTATVDEIPQSTSEGEGQIVMFRVDCDNANWTFGEVIEIVPGQRSDGSGSAPTTTTPPASTTPPATGGTCAQRVGQACNCATCCNGDGCDDEGGAIINKVATDDPNKCVCKCKNPCGGGDSNDDDNNNDDDNGGDDNGDNAEEFDEDSPAAKEQNDRINRCSGLTGATYNACIAGAAVSNRRGNLARAAYAVYSPNYFKIHHRIRIGNIR